MIMVNKSFKLSMIDRGLIKSENSLKEKIIKKANLEYKKHSPSTTLEDLKCLQLKSLNY